MSSLALAIFADVGVTVIVILNSLQLLRFETETTRDYKGIISTSKGSYTVIKES